MEKEVDSKIFLIAIIAIVVIVLVANNFNFTGEAPKKFPKSTPSIPSIYIDQTTYFDRNEVPQTTVYHGINWNCMETKVANYDRTYQVGTYPTTNLARSLIKSGITDMLVTKDVSTWRCMFVQNHHQTNSPEWVVRSTKEVPYEIRTDSSGGIPMYTYVSEKKQLKYTGHVRAEYYRTGK